SPGSGRGPPTVRPTTVGAAGFAASRGAASSVPVFTGGGPTGVGKAVGRLATWRSIRNTAAAIPTSAIASIRRDLGSRLDNQPGSESRGGGRFPASRARSWEDMSPALAGYGLLH